MLLEKIGHKRISSIGSKTGRKEEKSARAIAKERVRMARLRLQDWRLR